MLFVLSKITPIGQLGALGTGDAGPVPLGRLPPAKPHRAPSTPPPPPPPSPAAQPPRRRSESP
eukprot:SAG22_NODE_18891_length_280_cov_0.856354_1_plen_62_part_10